MKWGECCIGGKGILENGWKQRYLEEMVRFIVASVQNAGVGSNSLLPCTIKRRLMTNLKTEGNENCQKIICMKVQQPRD